MVTLTPALLSVFLQKFWKRIEKGIGINQGKNQPNPHYTFHFALLFENICSVHSSAENGDSVHKPSFVCFKAHPHWSQWELVSIGKRLWDCSIRSPKFKFQPLDNSDCSVFGYIFQVHKDLFKLSSLYVKKQSPICRSNECSFRFVLFSLFLGGKDNIYFF